MSTEAQIDAALEAVLTAARNHRAVLRAGASEERVWRAYIALNNATVRYDDLISEVYDEVTPWDCEYLDGDAPPAAAAEGPALAAYQDEEAYEVAGPLMVTVRHRRDYVIPEPGRLLALATEARQRAWASVNADHAARPVTEVGEAVNELVQAGDGTVSALDQFPEELIPGNGVLLVNALHRPLTFPEQPVEGDEPLLLGVDEVQLYRMDEEVVDEDTLEEPAYPAPREPLADPTMPVW